MHMYQAMVPPETAIPAVGENGAEAGASVPVYMSDALTITLEDDDIAAVVAEGYETEDGESRWPFGVVSEGRTGDLSSTFAETDEMMTHPAIAERLAGKLTSGTTRVSLKSLEQALRLAEMESARFKVVTGFLCADRISGVSLWLRWAEGLNLVLDVARNGLLVESIPVGVRKGKRTHYLQITSTKATKCSVLAPLLEGRLREGGSNSSPLHEIVAIVGDGVSYTRGGRRHVAHHNNNNGGDNRLENLTHIFEDKHNHLHSITDRSLRPYLERAAKSGDYLANLPHDFAREIANDHKRLQGVRDDYFPEGTELIDLSQSFDDVRMVASSAFLEIVPEIDPKTRNPKKDENGRTIYQQNVVTRTVTSDGNSVTSGEDLPPGLSPARPFSLDVGIGEVRWSSAGMDAFARGEQPIPDLAEQLLALVDRYVSFAKPAHLYVVVAYIAMTYVFTLARRVPFLAVHSIAPDSGKTTLLEVMNRLVFNSVSAAQTSRAAIVRMADAARCTLILDEQEKLASDSANDGIIEVLNSRHIKGALYRIVGRDQPIQSFDLFGPTITANLKGLTPTLLSRSIVIEMQPMPTGDPRSRNKVGVNFEKWQWLRDQLYLWAGRHWKDVKVAYEHDPSLTAGSNRQADLWRLMFAVAKHLGGDEMLNILREEVATTMRPQTLDDETVAIIVGLQRAIEDCGPDATEIPVQHVCNLAVEHLEGAPPVPGRKGNHAMNKRIKAFCLSLELEVRLSSRFNKANAIRLSDPKSTLQMLRERFPALLAA